MRVLMAGALFMMPAILSAENVGIFFDAAVPQTTLAAGEVKKALEARGHTGEMQELTNLAAFTGKKVVIAQLVDNEVLSAMVLAGGEAIADLEEQGLALRTTETGGLAWWAIGGDARGAMYAGLELAKKLQVYGLTGSWNFQQNAFIKNRGIKFNIALDKRNRTYMSKDIEYINEMIKNVWDMSFWEEYIDHMARARYNMLTFWCYHPFTVMLKVPGYEDVALEDVYDYKGKIKDMTIDEKIAHWKAVHALAASRGIQIYWMTWNLFTDGAGGKYGITEDLTNQATRNYLRTTMTHFLKEYPEISGFIIHAGEHFPGVPDRAKRAEFCWDTYGRGINDYQQQYDPLKKRNFNFIYRLHEGSTEVISTHFDNLVYNYDYSIKYSWAHMYSYPAPTFHLSEGGENLLTQMKKLNRRFWLNVRNDDIYYLNWGNYQFAQSYILNIPQDPGDTDKERYVPGFYIGSDGNTETRTWYAKDEFHNGRLDTKKNWYKWYAFGYAGYDPYRTEEDFKDIIRLQIPGLSADLLYDVWGSASRGIPMANALTTGSWITDSQFWVEGCWSGEGWRSIKDFAAQRPINGAQLPIIYPSGSDWAPKGLCSFRAYNNCGSKETPVAWGERMKEYAKKGLGGPGGSADKTVQLTLDDIRALAYLGWYYSGKVRAAAHDSEGEQPQAIEAAGEAYHAWRKYAQIMDKNYTSRGHNRVKDWDSWGAHLDDALADYHSVGGTGIPEDNVGVQKENPGLPETIGR